MISPAFYIFFDIFIFQALNGENGQKTAQVDKTFCLLHFISQEPYIIWLSFIVHLCEMMIYPGVFSFFQNFGSMGC